MSNKITMADLRKLQEGQKGSKKTALTDIGLLAVTTGRIKGEMFCERCQTSVPKTNHRQKYCTACSAICDLERKKLWAKDNPPSSEQAQKSYGQRRKRAKENGAKTSKLQASDITWMADDAPDLLWLVRIKFPFDYAISKNHIYTTRQNGHIALRTEHRHIRDVLGLAIKNALKNQTVVQNKVWLDILVQKPDHKGDAINVVDAVADVIKHSIGVDDRWFSIRRLDWEIVKENPHIFVGIGQESDTPVQVCSFCGRMLEFSSFNKNKGNKSGITRDCIDCRKLLR